MREQVFKCRQSAPYLLDDAGLGTPDVPLLSLVPHLRPAFLVRALFYAKDAAHDHQ